MQCSCWFLKTSGHFPIFIHLLCQIFYFPTYTWYNSVLNCPEDNTLFRPLGTSTLPNVFYFWYLSLSCRAAIIYHDIHISWFPITKWCTDSASIRLSTFQAFCRTLKHFNQTIKKYFMALLSDIIHVLHFHSFIAKVTKWKSRNIIYVHFVFIYKSSCKMFNKHLSVNFKIYR